MTQGMVTDSFKIHIFIKDGTRIGIKVNGKAVIGLLGGDIDVVLCHILLPEVIHIRETQGGESAEAEKVTGFGKGTGLLDLFLVLIAVHIKQLNLLAVLGNWEIVEGIQLILVQEDDGLLHHFELGFVAGDGILTGISLPERPVGEPEEILILLADGIVLQPLVLAEVGNELIEAGLVEELERDILLEFLHMVSEGKPALVGGIGPLLHGFRPTGQGQH